MAALFYEGKTLLQYCLEKDYNYHTIRNYIINKDLSIKDAIDLYLQRRGRQNNNCKYYYKGQPVKSYCVEYGIPYDTIYKRITVYKDTIEEAFEHWYIYRNKVNAKRKKKKS
jgi:hypothetical protein